MNETERSSGITASTGPIPRSEWAVALFGLLTVVSAIGYLVYVAVFIPAKPADVVVRIDHVAPASGSHHVAVTVENLGGETAAEVMIEGTLSRGASAVEASEVTFDFVPPGSRRSATLVFREDPNTLPLAVRVVGFREP